MGMGERCSELIRVVSTVRAIKGFTGFDTLINIKVVLTLVLD